MITIELIGFSPSSHNPLAAEMARENYLVNSIVELIKKDLPRLSKDIIVIAHSGSWVKRIDGTMKPIIKISHTFELDIVKIRESIEKIPDFNFEIITVIHK